LLIIVKIILNDYGVNISSIIFGFNFYLKVGPQTGGEGPDP
jgi:predicted methyltransferase